MNPIDWILVSASLLLVLGIGVYTQRYVKSVAHFMSAGRLASRYMLTIAAGEMGAGPVIYVAMFEVISNSGFSTWWWGFIGAPIGLILGIYGWVTYRYRETRAMTLGQFFEIRYSRNFRLFAGIVGFLAGIVNFGIMPMVGARFMVYLFAFDPTIHFAGLDVPTYIPLMGTLLLINLFVVLSGGLVTMIVTNFMEGIISQVFTMVIVVGLLCMFTWGQLHHTLATGHGDGEPFLNPFHSGSLKDFNIWYIIMGIIGSMYGVMAWQNQSAYSSAPLSAHEGRMGGLMGRVRGLGMGVMLILCLCAMSYMHEPEFATQALAVKAQVATIDGAKLQQQMTIPIAVSHLLPVGLKGAFLAMLLLGSIGGDCNHLHSWGSIFIQDVVLPFRKKPFTPKQHLFALRCSITGVAIAVFTFGCIYRQTEYIMMWWAITCSIFVGGAGVAIIGGLYWKKGTAPGAWAGMITGSIIAVSGIIGRQYLGDRLPNGQVISMIGIACAVTVYTVVSLLTCRQPFNLQKMLHRGIYADPGQPAVAPRRLTWSTLIGYDNNFTRGDKTIAGGLFAWSMMWVAIMAGGSLWYIFKPWSNSVWGEFWHYYVILIPLAFAVVITPWFLWGGIRDLRDLFRRLAAQQVDVHDDGTVETTPSIPAVALPPNAETLTEDAVAETKA